MPWKQKRGSAVLNRLQACPARLHLIQGLSRLGVNLCALRCYRGDFDPQHVIVCEFDIGITMSSDHSNQEKGIDVTESNGNWLGTDEYFNAMSCMSQQKS